VAPISDLWRRAAARVAGKVPAPAAHTFAPGEGSPNACFAVLFRVHFWNDDVARQYGLVARQVTQGDVWVVVDETNGAVDLPARARRFSITVADTTNLGLAGFPDGQVFWYNNDYALYLFHASHPDYAYYVIVEHDVAVLAPLDALVLAAGSNQIDLVALPNKLREGGWGWMHTCTEVWPESAIRPHLLCFAIISNRAVAPLLLRRQDHAVQFGAGALKQWPLAEGFVPTLLREQGFALADLAGMANTELYDWWPPTHANRLTALPDQSIVHPVLAGAPYAESLLRFDYLSPDTWFTPNSELRISLDAEPIELVAPILARAFIRIGRLDLLMALPDFVTSEAAAALAGLIDAEISRITAGHPRRALQPGRCATQSSVSPWSRARMREQDASGAVTGEPSGSYTFHTAFELNPWWMLDLDRIAIVAEIRVYNRLDAESGRSNNLSVWHSTNARVWTLAYRRVATEPFGGADGAPLRIELTPARPVRYVRIEIDGIAALHLDRVVVDGWEIGAPAA
jgi:hypothetical protein